MLNGEKRGHHSSRHKGLSLTFSISLLDLAEQPIRVTSTANSTCSIGQKAADKYQVVPTLINKIWAKMLTDDPSINS